MLRPYLSPKNQGGSDHGVGQGLGTRKQPSAPWELSTPGRARPNAPAEMRPIGTAQDKATPRSGGRHPERDDRLARSQQDPAPPMDPTRPIQANNLSIDEDATSGSYTRADAESFWSLPEVAAVTARPAQEAGDIPALSGPAEEFDDATGWNYPAAALPDGLEPSLRLTDEERALPVLPSLDEIFSVTNPEMIPVSTPGAPRVPDDGMTQTSAGPQSRPFAPGPAPADIETLLSQGRELLSSGDLAQAVKLLRRAKRMDPAHNQVITWLEFAERRLMREHLPNATPDSIPTPTQDRRKLLAQASVHERQVLGVLDGKRSLSVVLRAGTADAVVPMLKMLAAFESRRWITWA